MKIKKILVSQPQPATGKSPYFDIAEKYGVSIPRLCIRYCLEKNTLPLPKSVHKERIEANIDLDFEIEKADLDYLDSLGHIGPVKDLRS